MGVSIPKLDTVRWGRFTYFVKEKTTINNALYLDGRRTSFSFSECTRGRVTLSFTQLGAAILTLRIILTTGPSERSVPFRRLVVGVVQRAGGTLG